MIKITRIGTKVRVELEAGYPLSNTYYFNCDVDNEDFSKLLWVHFDDKLSKAIEAIRKEEYDLGYRDGRAKRAKRNWFTSWLKTGTYK